ncbi:hypothetical protein B0H17DRAFT_1216122 [Mycena rosella]|uniref:Uncharacterized protein n=1 Tax=Mycena rosella TaxID=1033263 RepID=A0AAD7CCP1_MYCRO|nr:hypothetical protein B0H17DRAFT_1216122 [Mycena rosella]
MIEVNSNTGTSFEDVRIDVLVVSRPALTETASAVPFRRARRLIAAALPTPSDIAPFVPRLPTRPDPAVAPPRRVCLRACGGALSLARAAVTSHGDHDRLPPHRFGLHTVDGAHAASVPLPSAVVFDAAAPLPPSPSTIWQTAPMTLSLGCNTLNPRPLDHSSSYTGCRLASQAPLDSHSGRPLAERAVIDLHAPLISEPAQPVVALADRFITVASRGRNGAYSYIELLFCFLFCSFSQISSDCPISIHVVVDVIRPRRAHNRRLYGVYLCLLGVVLAGSLRAFRQYDADAAKRRLRPSSCIWAHAFAAPTSSICQHKHNARPRTTPSVHVQASSMGHPSPSRPLNVPRAVLELRRSSPSTPPTLTVLFAAPPPPFVIPM